MLGLVLWVSLDCKLVGVLLHKKTSLWACLRGSFQRGVTEVRGPTLNVGVTSPRVGLGLNKGQL